MKQFYEAKQKYSDSIMLFRMGDFYETFDEDARITSEILGITLTKRSNGAASSVPLAGFPFHSLDQHLHKLLKAGHRVAICEQVENPKETKGIVKREVVEVLSPGMALSEKYLEQNENNFLCAVVLGDLKCGITLLDYSTGELFTCSRNKMELSKILKQFNVSEMIVCEDQEQDFDLILDNSLLFKTKIPDWCHSHGSAYESIISFFNVKSLKGFGIENDELAISSVGCALYYIEQNYKGKIKHITSLSVLKEDGIMGLDDFTIRNLELFTSLSNQGIHGTLIKTIDKTITSAGSRLLKNWLRQPLTDKLIIIDRLDRINNLIDNEKILIKLREKLREISDIERIIARISTDKASPRDIVNLGISLKEIPSFNTIISKKEKSLFKLLHRFNNVDEIATKILSTIKLDPPVNINKGGYIQSGVSSALDELHQLSNDASSWMIEMQIKERKETSIPSLKIGYNRIFGYYLEVTKSHIDKVPEHYIRKQTLTNSERYFTEELKTYEEKILSAQEKIIELELSILDALKKDILIFTKEIQMNAKVFSRFDVALGLAMLALEKKYNRPIIMESNSLEIKNGRHPVVEDLLPIGEDFIPNDLELDHENTQIAIITGPNMAGKSTYLRQVGILVILSQIGSYIPADFAKIGIIDKLFTRVGASDNLAGGESTFLVEMNETANILNNATSNSLILLDEIGRGTSTYDGLSIAWAVTEYIHGHKELQTKTLFATHYHELVDLANQLPKAINLNVAVKEFGNKIIFLKKIISGGADKSYGIHVAEMAGLPHAVILRAKQLLQEYSSDDDVQLPDALLEPLPQMDLFSKKELEFKKELNKININDMTPLEALSILDELKKKHGV
ncbi:MAG: DNA mismatch repair protein MutS [Pelagibacteraceae bacterium]|nr:DNA mismatch repair protein MutS [Pelagibacteraceae bacterium]